MSITNIDKAFEQALLSKLAYKTPSELTFETLQKVISPPLIGSRVFTDSEAKYIADNFVLIDKKNDFGDFQACWVQNKNTGEITYAIAGTSLLDYGDIQEDFDITTKGMAFEQFIKAYNYYQRMAGGDEIYVIEKRVFEPSFEDLGAAKYIEIPGEGYFYLRKEINNNPNKIDSSNISITGHSLGGHLAGLIAMATGNYATIFDAPGYHTYNIHGLFIKIHEYYQSGEKAESFGWSHVNAFISGLLGASTSQSKIEHIFNDNYAEIIADAERWGNSTGIDGFEQDFFNNHHSLDYIVNTFYAYQVMKGVITDDSAFFKNLYQFSSKNIFEDVYNAYSVSTGNPKQELDFGNNNQIQSLIDDFKKWIDSEIKLGKNLIIDTNYSNNQKAISGGGEENTIFSGYGDDKIYGGAGADTYVYNLGDGFDIIEDIDHWSVNDETRPKDTIIFGEGINFENLSFRKDEFNLNILINGDENQKIEIRDYYYSKDNKIELVEFADGSTFNLSDCIGSANQLIQAMSSFGLKNATTMSLCMSELNTTENILATSYNKVD